jgi:hypothetical protein
MKIFWGIIGIGIGFVVIKYSFQLVQFFGHIPWAERHMGGGGTYMLYKITGLIVIALSMLYMFNGLGFLTGPTSTIFPK